MPKAKTEFDHTPIYNVKAAAQMTGLSPVILRAWERRYGLPAPQRGEQGYRLYSEYDIQTLHWLKAQIQTGLSISRAAHRLAELRAAGNDPAVEPPVEGAFPAEAASIAEGVQLLPGEPAPDCVVTDTHSKPFRLRDAWQNGPILLAFLRHFGCIFCREMLVKLERQHDDIKSAPLKLVLIGLGDPEQAEQLCRQLVPDALCLCNKTGEAYAAYGLNHGTLMQLAGPQVMAAAVRAARSGHFQGETTGDITLLGGMFVIDQKGFIRYTFYSQHAGDNPDIAEIIQQARKALVQKT